jgi:hypothetical protein
MKKPIQLTDIGRRVARARAPLASELLRRGIEPQLNTEALNQHPRMAGALLAAELANADRQLAARAVVRGLLSTEELRQLAVMLKFQPRGGRTAKLNELTRAVERALEGGVSGNCR